MKASWEVKPLGGVCDFKGGSQPPKSQFISEPRDGYIRMLQIRDFKSEDKAVYIPVTPKTNVCEAKDIMIGRYGASVGQIHRGKAGAYNVALIRTIPDLSQIDQDFLYHYLTSDLFQKPLMLVSKRGAQDGFSKPDIAPFPFPIPPLEEQKRIVAVLDAAFEGLTRAEENAKANLQNARDLFEASILIEFKKLQHDFDSKRIADIADHRLGKMLDKNKNKGILRSYLRNKNVQWFQIDTDDLLEMRIEENEIEKYTVEKGDLLICEGGYPGRAAIWKKDEAIFFQKALHRVRFPDPTYNSLLLYWLYLVDQTGKLVEHCSGAGIQHFTGKSLAKFEMPFPSKDAALKAVALIERTKQKSEVLEANYQTKLSDISHLRQSLLQKAFAGELT